MADNILRGIITVDAPNISQTTNTVVNSAAKMEGALKKIAPSSNSANIALINTGRVLQDLPFGIVGVANNINPLVESFQRLKAESGSTSTALKSLVGSLAGGGGLGLAVSLVTSALTFAAIGFSSFSRGTQKAKESTDEARESMEQLAKSVSGELVSLTSLVGIVTNVNSKTQERSDAIKALNEKYGDYLKNMGLEEVSLGNINKAYDLLIDNLLRKAIVKGIQEQVTKEVEATAKKIIEIQTAQEKLKPTGASLSPEQIKKTNEAIKAYKDSINQVLIPTKSYNQNLKDGVIAQQSINAEIGKASPSILTYAERMEKLKNELKATLSPLLSIATNISDLDIKIKTDKTDDTLLKEREKIIAHARELFKFNERDFPEQELQLKLKVLPLTEFNNEVLKNFLDDLLNDVTFEVRKRAQDFNKVITDGVKSLITPLATKPNPTEVHVPVVLIPDVNKTKVSKEAEALAEIVSKSLSDAFATIGENLGGALAGGFDVKKIFQGIFLSIGQVLKDLGKQIIIYSSLISKIQKAIQAAFAGNPALGIGLGIALIAAGTALQKAIQPRAGGGPVGFAQTYLVGEKGPELFVPSQSGTIIPNSRIGAIQGSQNIQVTGSVIGVDGTIIKIALQRVDRLGKNI